MNMNLVIPTDGRERASLPGIDHLTLAGGAQGLSSLSVWQQSIDAGEATPPHRHDCEEVVVVGEGWACWSSRACGVRSARPARWWCPETRLTRS